MWKAKLAWVQEEEMMSYTMLNLISLSNVIYLRSSAIPALYSAVAALLLRQEYAGEILTLNSFAL